MKDVYAYIDAHAQDAVEMLVRLCRQPSISAQRIGLDEMATLMATVLREEGFDAALHPTCTGVPVVIGEMAADASVRTLLVYNHYDVQPPEPLELWTSPPFEPAVRNGKVFARGATDNKGNIVSRLMAIRALRAVRGKVPVNLKYLIEGEEEISSQGLPDFLEHNAGMLEADGCLWEDTMGRVDAPVVSLGNKGICKLELRCKVASVDSHSSYAGLYPNAIWRLTWALASIKGPDERVLVAGFYDRVRKLSGDEEAIAAMLPPTDGAHLKRVRGLKRLLLDLDDKHIHRRLSLEPTCNISGIEGGYTGKGSKTVLPAEAFARLDMRLVADQDPGEIANLVRKHLAASGFDDIEVHDLGSAYPSMTAVDTPLNRAIAQASRDAYGKDAIFELHQAGATPQWVIQRYLRMPCSATGVGYVTSMTHAPDENIRIDHLIEGAKYMASIMTRFASA